MRRSNSIFNRRTLSIACCHFMVASVSLVASYLLRFDFSVPADELPIFRTGLLLAIAAKLLVFHLARLHRAPWRMAGIADLNRVFVANLFASLLFSAAGILVLQGQFPRTVYVIDFLICFLMLGGLRLGARVYREILNGERSRSGRKPMLVYGAGAAGLTLVREIRGNPGLGCEVVGFLDDNPGKRGLILNGVSVMGTGRDAPDIVERFRRLRRQAPEIVIAMPSATGRQMREAAANCRASGATCKTIPGLGELLAGNVLVDQIRNISLTDLLGREPVWLEDDRIRSQIAGRTVLVTGGAGSIGSELCRQIAGYGPRLLIVLDQAESALYKVDLELRDAFPRVQIAAEIGDICDTRRIDEIMSRWRVDSVFHAAAYKHVPLMETHILEAIKNNVFGTWNLVQAASRHGVKDFLMISSDKAVRPTSVMGATKHIAELIVAAMQSSSSGTRFVSVRFGNVLGSNGSVIPLFQEQIAAGGPVTVTHPDMRRYFMTVREAVQLVLQASTMGQGGEIFCLDMGEPVRIVDLARNMIRLAGKIPDEEIEIRYVGIRPGEKLYEELITEGEDVLPTHHQKIKIFKGRASVSTHLIEAWLDRGRTLLAQGDESAVVAHMVSLVPDYQPSKPRAVNPLAWRLDPDALAARTYRKVS